MSTSILLCDDHGIVRDGLRMLFDTCPEYRLVGEADSGNEALRLARELQADIAILDINMPIMSGIDITRHIRNDCPRTRVIILSMYTDDEHVLAALRAGAMGYVLKASVGRELIEAVRSVANNHIYLSQPLSDAMILHMLAQTNGDEAEAPLARLSAREREILLLVVDGRSSVEIGEMLGISPATVDTYRSRLMGKLRISNIAELVKFAIRHGLIALD